MEGKLTFIGAGSMAEAMISGILTKKFTASKNIFVINKSNKERLEYLQKSYGVICNTDKEQAVKDAKIIILSVKPKDVVEALQAIQPFLLRHQLIISVVAGVSTDFISNTLQSEAPIIRAMPNTSASIGFSATAIAAGKYATKVDLDQACTLFQTIGTVTIVPEEDLHAVTGLSGSGPAYIYYLVEAMEKAAVDVGLDKKTAKELIVQTLAGTAEMLKVSNADASVLRKKVTSPGGTTQAGLETLQQFHYQEALIACIQNATHRSMELGADYE